jgi:uncharacterized protein
MTRHFSTLFVAIGAFAIPLLTGAQEKPPASSPVVHVEVLGVDAPRLQRFYSEVFGWKVTTNPAGYGYVPVAPAPPAMLSGGIGASPQKQALVVFYVKVDDPAATLRRAEALGGKIVVPPTDVPGGVTFARFADPEGNVIGIVRRPN